MKKIILFILFVGLLCGGYYSTILFKEENLSSKAALDSTYTVSRMDLEIGLQVGGSVNAKNKKKIKLEAKVATKLVWIVSEGVYVKKGDLLAKFDTENIDWSLEYIRLDLETIRKELEILEEEKKILISTNVELIRVAEDKVTSSIDALNKYIKLDAPKEKDSLNKDVAKTNVELKEANENYREIQNELQMVYKNKKDEEKGKDKLKEKLKDVKMKVDALDDAEYKLKIFKRHTYLDKIKSLKNGLAQSRLALKKAKVTIESSLIKKDSQINSKLRIKIKKDKELEKFIKFLTQMEIRSSVNGIVIYGDVDKRKNKINIDLGMDIHRGVVLLSIPEMSNMIVNFNIPESYRNRVQIGAKVIVSSSAIRSLKIHGQVTKIATLPINTIHWDPSSPKVYRAIIELDKQSKQFVSGMSVNIDIVSKVLKDTIAVPIEVIHSKNENYFVYIKNRNQVKRQNITIGNITNSYCEIVKGLEEGDIISLDIP